MSHPECPNSFYGDKRLCAVRSALRVGISNSRTPIIPVTLEMAECNHPENSPFQSCILYRCQSDSHRQPTSTSTTPLPQT